MLEILGRASSLNVRKVLWTCKELSLAFDREDYGTGFRSLETEEFRGLNPNAQIPVIIDGDFVLWESNTICRYLINKAERDDLLPSDPVSRARVEQWVDWQATELNQAWRYAFCALHWKYPAYQDTDQIAASVKAWNRMMAILDAQLAKTGAYVSGSDFTLADIVLGLSTNRWLRTPIERPVYPAVAEWYSRLCERPAFLEYGPNGTI
ncbi:hypothetical protein AEAC466_10140 [Asticcacaulis sp. AC466]|uniref:glutathione S-transferase family protein n=1 Tax=Asticcacaulis sp. AC466 TaxID=1282362 RepID=UPI0003C3F5FE|nr:glutathione S-transferase [Asticcacaulis sp. AC466]ESQ84096.1 hypothetical protein AEAC466_10140 [Asticcacaulis sp. AC466]